MNCEFPMNPFTKPAFATDAIPAVTARTVVNKTARFPIPIAQISSQKMTEKIPLPSPACFNLAITRVVTEFVNKFLPPTMGNAQERKNCSIWSVCERTILSQSADFTLFNDKTFVCPTQCLVHSAYNAFEYVLNENCAPHWGLVER